LQEALSTSEINFELTFAHVRARDAGALSQKREEKVLKERQRISK
jgi:hypothetical protein